MCFIVNVACVDGVLCCVYVLSLFVFGVLCCLCFAESDRLWEVCPGMIDLFFVFCVINTVDALSKTGTQFAKNSYFL